MIEILRGPLDEIGCRATSSGDQVHYSVHFATFVVVDMSGRNEEAGVGSFSGLRKVLAESDFVWPGVMIDLDVFLDVSDGWVVHADDYEIDRFGESFDLFIDPARLRAAREQVLIAVERKDVDPGTELD